MISNFPSRQSHDPDLRNHTIEFLFLIMLLACSMAGPLLDANNTKMTKIGCSWGCGLTDDTDMEAV